MQKNCKLLPNDSTILKGVAIVLILISHIAGMYHIRYFTPLGGIGVAIFLFLSGYGLVESFNRNGLHGFWTKRICTVFVPYFLVEVLATLVVGKVEILDFIKSILLIEPKQSQIWYLQYLLLCYICFWCIYKFVGKTYRNISLFVMAVLSIFLLPEIAAEQAMSFWCGCLLAKRKALFSRLHSISILCLGLGIVALALKQLDVVRGAPQVVMNFVQLSIKLPIALFIINFVMRTVNVLKYPISYRIGKISYELYLVHINFLLWITEDIWTVPIFVLVTLAASIVLHIVGGKINNMLLKKIK